MARIVATVVTALTASAGCAQLAGIDDTSGDHRAVNALTVVRLSIGATLVRTPLDLGGLEASFLVPDATGAIARLPGLTDPSRPGAWTRDLAQPAPVEFTLPDVPTPILRTLAFPSQTMSLLFGVLEHPMRTLAPGNATLALSVPLDTAAAPGESFLAYTVGSWSQRALPAPVAGAVQLAVPAYPFSSSTSVSGRPLDLLTTQDVLLVLRYVGARLTGVAEAAPFDQTGTDNLTLPAMTAVPADRQLDLKVHPGALSQRFSAARPAVSTLVMNWSLVAAPGASVASNAGPVLTSGAVAATDTAIAATYGDPFAASALHPWPELVTFATSVSRVVTPPGMTLPVTLNAGLNQFLAPSPGYDLTLPVGLPVLITLGTTQLTADGIMYPRPPGYVDVTYISDNNDAATIYSIQLFELVVTPGGVALDRRLTFAASSDHPKFQLRPDLFEIGHTYTLRAICQLGGYPQAATGDLTARELPLGQGYLDSAVFTVAP